MRLSAPIFYLKRQAKLMARAADIPLSNALDKIAQAEGFQTWSHLARSAKMDCTATRLESALKPGTLGLIAARPSQGKTLLALEVLAAVGGGHFFTLDYTDAEARERYASAGGAAPLQIDTSDEISADTITARLEGCAKGTLAVIDYLQLLDQQRSKPPLAEQVHQLAAFNKRSGARILYISQIDRRFDPALGLPTAEDIRMPNPIDLALFTTTCFLHDGRVQLN